MEPTDEQLDAINAAMSGDHLAIEAMAGTGKTSTLVLIADVKQNFRDLGSYIAFNKAIVSDAEKAFGGSNVACSTVHSLAHKVVGHRFRSRFKSPRMTSRDIARYLHIRPVTIRTAFGEKRLADGFLAGLTVKGVREFCRTADPEPTWQHIPVPDSMRSSEELRAGWEDVARSLEPQLLRVWEDAQDPSGVLPYDQGAYLKMWQLLGPKINCDYLMVDEAQDLNGVMLAIAEWQQDHAQLIAVGDSRQQIYEWNGSLNAMAQMKVDRRVWLTRSFRFGPEIAGVANQVLHYLGDARVIGAGRAGRVGPIDYPDCVLSRTNATAVSYALNELMAGGSPHIVGGAEDVISFARGALDLQEGKQSWHPDLVCFSTWAEVRAYVEEDQLGQDLKLLVDLIDKFTAERIIAVLESMPPEEDASVVVSTAHKSKGRQFHAVQIAGDFPDYTGDRSVSEEEYRLQYVAVTRARSALDVAALGSVA